VSFTTFTAAAQQYGVALGLASLVTVASWFLQRLVGSWSVALLYLLIVMISGTLLRRGPTLCLAALSALLWNYLFIPPIFTFHIGAPQDVMMFLMFFAVALTVGHLSTRLRDRERVEQRRERRASALYKLARELAAADSRDAVVSVFMAHLHTVLGMKAAALLVDETSTFELQPHPASTWALPENETVVAASVFENKRASARSLTADSSALHLPLLVADRIEGVLAVEVANDAALTAEQHQLLEAFATQLAVVAEKERLAAAHRRAEILAESEKLQKTLFDCVSHELKTPVAAIRAALDQPQLDRGEIARANDRLRRAVEHLLDATRIESGMLKPNLEWCDPFELAQDATTRAGLTYEQVHIDATAELPAIRIDAGLLEQGLASLLHNATTHGNSFEPCVLSIRCENDFVRFDVTDRGPGLPHGSEEKLFEKFYRPPGSPTGGLGLGLSIARRLAEAHGGTLTSENRPAGGARFTLRVPIGGELHLPT
jgi:two-component system sensor histidine kinase KdpD